MIPRRFTLVNKKYLVRLLTTKQLQKHLDKHPAAGEEHVAGGLMGLCDPAAARIFINTDLHQSTEEQEHTYCHEFVHALKFANGESDHDEEEVDRLAGMLHQYFLTKEER